MSERSRLVLVWRAAASCLLGALLVFSKLGCASTPDSEPPSAMPICPYTGDTPPFLDPTSFPECPVTACPGIPMGNRAAHCISNAAIGSLGVAPDVLAQLGPCDEGSRCVPDLFAGYMLTKLPKTCRSLRGADGKPVEGRCLSRCLTQVHDMEGMLPKTSDGCDPATELCAPCYDPRHGALLPACTLGSLPDGGTCDKPKEPVVQWQRCCDNGGTCLPDEVIPPAKAKNLAQKECPSTFKCAPQVAVEDPTWSPRECRTGGGPLGVAFSKDGRCVPICALDTTGFAGTLKNLVLNQGVDEDGFKACAEAEKCAPCKNLGSDTGACDL